MAWSEAEGDAHRWPLHGFWRTWFWFSALLGVALLVVGAAITAFAVVGGAPLLLLPGLVVLAVGAVIGWQVLNTATAVTLRGDGSLLLQRVRGPLHTRVAAVTRARRSVLRSSYTPTVLETADGWAYLIHDRRDKDEIIAAIRAGNPGLRAEV